MTRTRRACARQPRVRGTWSVARWFLVGLRIRVHLTLTHSTFAKTEAFLKTHLAGFSDFLLPRLVLLPHCCYSQAQHLSFVTFA